MIDLNRTAEAEASTTDATEDLMARVQKGDLAAYRELIRRYQRKLYRVISSYHRNPEDAMEVLQDTFLKVYVARKTWEKRTSFAAWICRIAVNASIDRYRRGDKGRTSYIEDLGAAQMESSASWKAPPSPLESLDAQEKRRMLEEAVRRLPPRQREIVSLRYLAEMQLEEIAAALGCPLGTVKSNLHKAVNGLRAQLKGRKELWTHE